MRLQYLCILLILLVFPAVGPANTTTGSTDDTLEDLLYNDITDGRLDTFSHIEAGLILSGVTTRDSLIYHLSWFDALVDQLRTIHLDYTDRIKSAQMVFNYLHAVWLKTYSLESTTLLDIARNKQFNCVSATLLYNLVCDQLGWSTEAFETPTHVYTLFPNFIETVMVENTTPMGFNIIKNLDAYSRYLARFYPDNQVLRIGLDRLYLHENSHGRPINNTELLGLLAYNRAWLAERRMDYDRAYHLVKLAQAFNADSRSNLVFEKNLYIHWSGKLIENGRVSDAFFVLSEASYRFPGETLFQKNCMFALQNALDQSWTQKSWKNSEALLSEALTLDFLSEEAVRMMAFWINRWEKTLSVSGSGKDVSQIKKLRKTLIRISESIEANR